MRPGRAADHSHPSSTAVMEEYIYTSTNPLGHTGPVTGSLYLIYIYACVCICIYIYILGHTGPVTGSLYLIYMYVCMCVCVCVYVYIYIYIYIYTITCLAARYVDTFKSTKYVLFVKSVIT